MTMGLNQNKDEKEFRPPVSVFDAVRASGENQSLVNEDPPQKDHSREIKHDKRIEKDFIIPLHLIF